MSIEINTEHDDSIASGFVKGEIVLKITAVDRETDTERRYHIVFDVKDFEKRLYTHRYDPVLFLVGIHLRIGYLFGCLNREYRQPREEDFCVWWRKLKTDEWRRWFTIKGYYDSIYGEVAERVD